MRSGFDYIGISTPFYCHDEYGNILLHQRSTNCRDEQGFWDCGGGKLEYGLTLEQNVLKEIKEEYGCDGIINQQLPAHSLIRTINNQKTHWLIISFVVRVNPKYVVNNDPKKITQIKWFKFNNLPKPLHSGFVYSINKYQQLLKPFFY